MVWRMEFQLNKDQLLYKIRFIFRTIVKSSKNNPPNF